jgi:polysaccharide pyruvyl transferase WcaK-like protein
MNPWPKRLAADYCKDTRIITRNAESCQTLAEVGIPSELGTDTAWTFTPREPAFALQELRQVGWRGEPVLIVCPINPFWWPVTASLRKSLGRLLGFHRQSHYGRIFFFTWNQDVEQKFERYLEALARAVAAFQRRTGVFVVTAASEEIDNDAMQRLSVKLGGAPKFSSTNYNIYELVSVFRAADLMLSSRYHAIVTSMPGNVASAGVTMDERITNLMSDRHHANLLMTVDDSDLEAKAGAALDYLQHHREQVVAESRATVARQLRIVSHMGRQLVKFVQEKYPDFGPAPGLSGWEDYLPPLSRGLHQLLEEYPNQMVPAMNGP